jgi:hypothetical protein
MKPVILREFTFRPVNLWSLGPYKPGHYLSDDIKPTRGHDGKRERCLSANRKLHDLISRR